jgi:hypothetical protein
MVGGLLALAATVVWTGDFLLARGLRDEVPPVALNFWRWVVATTALAPFTMRATAASRVVGPVLGRCTVRRRAERAGTVISCARMVAVLARASVVEARQPAARVRL